MKRVSVIGTTGSGKTTFARELARRMNARHIELDALHWEPNWIEAPREIFRARVELATRGAAWTVDGNYSQARDIVWARADTIVWLDYPFPVVLWRLSTRTFKRVFTREELWNHNRENFATQFFTRDSLFLWLIQTYWRRRREYPELFARPENQHLAIVQLNSPRRAQTWLEHITVET
ncbi:MAG: AAA family ATPase [Chloroflexi bacterium]|nr:AAA family ATPase [Chloroflexota bacterium]